MDRLLFFSIGLFTSMTIFPIAYKICQSPSRIFPNRDWQTCGDPYNVCLLIWVAKLETSHVLQSNKNKSYRGRSDRLSVSIVNKHSQFAPNWKIGQSDEFLPNLVTLLTHSLSHLFQCPKLTKTSLLEGITLLTQRPANATFIYLGTRWSVWPGKIAKCL